MCVSEAANQLSASCLPLFFFWANLADDSFASSSPVLGNCIFHEHHPERARTRPFCASARVSFESGAGTGHWMEIMKAFLQKAPARRTNLETPDEGEEGGSKPQAAHFYTRFRWV